MDIRSLKIFIEAAELGSFTRAGERLGYSQPTVSFQIKQLEHELGVQLFDRIGHTVSLTDAGRDALGYAQRICLEYQEMSLGTDARRDPGGVVRLGMADSLCGPLIAEGFARFRKKYPKISRFFYLFCPKSRFSGLQIRFQKSIPGSEIPFIFLKVDTA